jgi:hypothetical protein
MSFGSRVFLTGACPLLAGLAVAACSKSAAPLTTVDTVAFLPYYSEQAYRNGVARKLFHSSAIPGENFDVLVVSLDSSATDGEMLAPPLTRRGALERNLPMMQEVQKKSKLVRAGRALPLVSQPRVQAALR